MQTLKTGFVILVLGAMFYGVYVVVNAPPPSVPKDVSQAMAEGEPTLTVDEGADPSEPATDGLGNSTNGGASAFPTANFPDPNLPTDRERGLLGPSTGTPAAGSGPAAVPAIPTAPAVPANPANPGDAASLAPPMRAVNEDRAALIDAATEPRRPVGLERGESTTPVERSGNTMTRPVQNPGAQPLGNSFAGPFPPNSSPPITAPPISSPPGDTPPGNTPSVDRAADTASASTSPNNPSPNTPSPNYPSSEYPSPSITDRAVNGASATSPGPVAPTPAVNGSLAEQPVDSGVGPPAVDPGTSNPVAGIASGAGPEGVRFDPKEAMIDRGWNEARAEVEAGKHRQALFILSRLYADPRLTAADRRRLQDALDPLAAQVIYSQQHTLEQPFLVRRGDTLPAIAEQYQVPWQLLANINGVRDPEFLVPGTKLKVVRGPFRAEINLADQELTLHLNQLYAGRFPIAVGQDPPPTVGEFEIKAKSEGREFATGDGQVIPAGHPANPYGTMFMEIGRNLAMHGSATAEDAAPSAGCISLSPRDALDVAGILSVGSTVTIRR